MQLMNLCTTSETILVVDDYGPLCELIELLLCRVGYHVVTAADANDALRIAGEMPRIDLLLTNFQIPGMRGDELSSLFRTLHPEAPIIFISDTIGEIDTMEPFEFLPKPFTIGELRRTVLQTLQMRSVSFDHAHGA